MKKIIACLMLPFFFFGCIPIPEEYELRVNLEERTPIAIGAVLPLSGRNKIYAEQMAEGLLCAEQIINSRHGIAGRELRLKIFDSAGTKEGAQRAMQQAAAEGCTAVVAGYSTEEVAMVIKHSERLRLPTVIPMATSNYHTEVSPFIYRNCYTDSQQAEALAAYIFYWKKVRRLGIFIDTCGDAEYSRTVARNMAQSMSTWGGEVVKTIMLHREDVSREQIKEMLLNNPQAIFIPSEGKRAAMILKKLRECGFHGIICGPDTLDDDAFVNELDGMNPGECCYTAFFTEEDSSREFIEFTKAFRNRFYHRPSACETQSYDALQLLAIALSSVKDLPNFDKNWCAVRNYVGAAGVYTMLPKGDIDRTIYVKSLGLETHGNKIVPFPRLSRSIQYSKIKDYREMY